MMFRSALSLPHLRRARLAVTLAALVTFAGCDDDPTGSGDAACRGNVTVGVSSGTTPLITWSPTCRVTALLVESEAGGDVWFIEQSGGEGIASGVRYGTVPEGAVEDEPATPLVEGESYDVIVFRGTGDNLAIAGVENFTP